MRLLYDITLCVCCTMLLFQATAVGGYYMSLFYNAVLDYTAVGDCCRRLMQTSALPALRKLLPQNTEKPCLRDHTGMEIVGVKVGWLSRLGCE